jgi:hypothetical protein
MSGTGKRTEDKLNLVGIVAVGLSASVFVYVSVVLLQAFYMNETATVNTTADFRGQENPHKTLKAAQETHIKEYGRNAGGPDQPQTYRVPVEVAIERVVAEAKADPSNLVPVVGKSTVPTIKAVFGRPQPLAAPAPAPGAAPGATDAAAPVPAADASATPAPAVQTTRPPESTTPPGLVPPVRTESAPPTPGATAPVVPPGGARASTTASGAASPPTPSPAPGRVKPPAQSGAGATKPATPPKGNAP